MALQQHVDSGFFAQYKSYVAKYLPFNLIDNLLSLTSVVYTLRGLTSFHRAFA